MTKGRLDAAQILGDRALQQRDKRGGFGVGQVRVHPGDSPAEEPKVCRLVWEFFCQVVFWFVAGCLFGAERPFLVPSPATRFAERAERCQGTEMLAQLSGLPLSVACIFAAP